MSETDTAGKGRCQMGACDQTAIAEVMERIGIQGQTREWNSYCGSHIGQRVRFLDDSQIKEWRETAGFLEWLPEIVCLCGSTKFEDAYKREQFRLTVEGKIVLTVAGNWKDDHRDIWDEIDDEDKAALDELHFRKIELADRVHVLNVGGYIGSSTRNEIDHAIETGTDISWLDSDEIPGPYSDNTPSQ